jgi:hypothetical protein
MRPSGIVSRSTSLRPVDFESGRNKGLLRRFLPGVQSRFEGKAGRGKKGCCHKSLVELGTFPFAFGQVTVVVVGVGVAGSIQHVQAHNKPCATNHTRNRSDQSRPTIGPAIRLLLTLELDTHTQQDPQQSHNPLPDDPAAHVYAHAHALSENPCKYLVPFES